MDKQTEMLKTMNKNIDHKCRECVERNCKIWKNMLDTLLEDEFEGVICIKECSRFHGYASELPRGEPKPPAGERGITTGRLTTEG